MQQLKLASLFGICGGTASGFKFINQLFRKLLLKKYKNDTDDITPQNGVDISNKSNSEFYKNVAQ